MRLLHTILLYWKMCFSHTLLRNFILHFYIVSRQIMPFLSFYTGQCSFFAPFFILWWKCSVLFWNLWPNQFYSGHLNGDVGKHIPIYGHRQHSLKSQNSYSTSLLNNGFEHLFGQMLRTVVSYHLYYDLEGTKHRVP